MKSRLIAAVTAAAVALGGLAATPAHAEKRNNDALKIILGAAAVGLIVNELNKSNRNSRSDRAQVYVPPFGNDDGYYRQQDGYRDWRYDDNRYRNSRSQRIPSECIYDVRTSDGRRDVVSASCMREFGLSRSLPQECAFQIRTNGGRSTVYGPNCLSRYGWRIASR